MTRDSHQDGTWAENQVRNWLEARSTAEKGFAYHRYPDTKAARLMKLPPQPSDYLASRMFRVGEKSRRIVAHVEVKETAQPRRLPKDKVRQYGKLKMFWWAGIDPVVIVFRSATKDWVMLRAPDLFPVTDEPPASFLIVDLPAFRTAGDALATIFYPK